MIVYQQAMEYVADLHIDNAALGENKLHQALPYEALSSSTPQTHLCSLLHFLPTPTQIA